MNDEYTHDDDMIDDEEDRDQEIGEGRITPEEMARNARVAAALMARIESAAQRVKVVESVDRATGQVELRRIWHKDKLNPSQLGLAIGRKGVIYRIKEGRHRDPTTIAKLAKIFGEPLADWYQAAEIPTEASTRRGAASADAAPDADAAPPLDRIGQAAAVRDIKNALYQMVADDAERLRTTYTLMEQVLADVRNGT